MSSWMNRKAEGKSYLRRPLNVLFGSPGAVRILREFILRDAPLPTSEIARRTDLSVAGVRKAIAPLIHAGLVEELGSGRVILYQVASRHPFAASIRDLFVLEHSRFQAVLNEIRLVLSPQTKPPIAAWVFGSAARGDDAVGSDLDVAILVADAEGVEPDVGKLNGALEEIERTQAVNISVIGLSYADIVRLSDSDNPFWRSLMRDGIRLSGPRPEEVLSANSFPQTPTPFRSRTGAAAAPGRKR